MKRHLINQLSFLLAGTLLLACLVGCGGDKTAPVPKPDIPMKTVTQNSEKDLVTFELQLPEKWDCSSLEYLSVGALDRANIDKANESAPDILEQALPFVIVADNYHSPKSSRKEATDETKQMYKDLFAGKTDSYEKYLNAYVASLIYLSSYEESELEIDPPTNLFGYFDLLTSSASSNSESSSPEEHYITDFQCQLYNGKNGKIAEVRYNYDYDGKSYQAINCIREDIPYMVSGGFDNSLELSSGEVALWVADSLNVTEHFTVEDGRIKKEG